MIYPCRMPRTQLPSTSPLPPSLPRPRPADHCRSRSRAPLPGPHRAERRLVRRPPGRTLRPARPERQRQDHSVPNSFDAHGPDFRAAPRSPGSTPFASREPCAATSASSFRRRASIPSSPPTKTSGIRDTSTAFAAPNSRPASRNPHPRRIARPRGRSRGNFLRRHAAPHRARQRACSIIPRFCFSTSPPPASIPAPGAIFGNIWEILRDQERVSVIVTTHLMEEAERCDRLAILNEGNLVALGTPEA
jgi:hypothetical protein